MSYQDHGRISVLMSVYNGADTLEKAINSILEQTYQNIEFIICDDASTDETWGIIQRYKEKDQRILCFQNQQNVGLGASLNRCFARSTGQFIARQDADDISDADRLERTISFCCLRPPPTPRVVFVFSITKAFGVCASIHRSLRNTPSHKRTLSFIRPCCFIEAFLSRSTDTARPQRRAAPRIMIL